MRYRLIDAVSARRVRCATLAPGRVSAACVVLLAAVALGFAGAVPPPARAVQACPNEQLRGEDNSLALPDCRAYEIVTPEDTGGIPIGAPGTDFWGFGQLYASSSQGTPSVVFHSQGGALPGLGGIGVRDTYDALRGPDGWSSRLIGPAGGQMELAIFSGISADHSYSVLWVAGSASENNKGTLVEPQQIVLLRHPDGSYTPLGQGELESPAGSGEIAVDFLSCGDYIAPGATHIVFQSGDPACAGLIVGPVQLRAGAPPTGTGAVYDRTPSGLHTVSLLPGDVTPVAGESSGFEGASADGSVVLFETPSAGEGPLYARLDDASTVKVTDPPFTPAGVSADGSEVFYVKAGDVFSFDTATQTTTQVTSVGDARLVNISADGSHVYFVSASQIGGEGMAGQPNLYVWDRTGGVTTFVATVAPADLAGEPCLTCWTSDVVPPPMQDLTPAPGNEISRTTPDGSAIVFQSQARLTAYDNTDANTGRPDGEIYRYATTAPVGGRLSCVSCDPGGARPVSSASLQTLQDSALPVPKQVVVSNLTADGRRVFFQSSDPLVSSDTDNAQDVYEWEAPGAGPAAGGCSTASSSYSPANDGCVVMVSSGQSPRVELNGEEVPTNRLYGVSPDGHDVYILVKDTLLSRDHSDHAGAIYDVREEGGFPAAQTNAEGCREDCQSAQGTVAPALSVPASATFNGAGDVPPPVKRRAKSPTRAQRLAGALKRCRRDRNRRRRPRCEASARHRYDPARKSAFKHGGVK